jgi:HemK-related putative methylase
LAEALASAPMRALRETIRAGARPECARCVCSMWRDPATASRRGSPPMLDAPMPSLLDQDKPGVLGTLAGKVLAFGYKLTGLVHYDRFRLERVHGVPVLVIPGVANPKLLRTGAFFASRIDAQLVAPGAAVLDMGTGSGVCALFAARHTARVVAVDVSPAAVRCTRLNAALNQLEDRIDVRLGDLFEPVAGQRFDLVLFNPPFLIGAPKDHRDAAWRSEDAARRFAAGLRYHLTPGGVALVLLSSFGDACALFESELRANGFDLAVFARRRFINETVTIVRATPRSEGRE